MKNKNIIKEVTGLHSEKVWTVIEPSNTSDVVDALQRTTGDVSIGGGRFSMGGQVFSPNSLHLDMRSMNKVLEFNPDKKQIKVQAGTRWCDIQAFIDPHNLSLQIMQTYANFTVGGSLSVNCHGRYIGLGPLILSVECITLVLADGSVIVASKDINKQYFFASVGCYGAIGIITEVVLNLTDNIKVERISKIIPLSDYQNYFKDITASDKEVVFHNADIYPPHFTKVRATSWVKTEKEVTEKHRLNGHKRFYLTEKYFFWAISETFSGKWRRENIIDNILFSGSKVHWRNYEAGYDVRELEPLSRDKSTYVLQEYFIPIRNMENFVSDAKSILNRFNVNVINISIRHALADTDSLLTWAPEEVFAFVLYYKQGTAINKRNEVAVWTRELIDSSLKNEGKHYLPYQAHASVEQFHQCYPKAKDLFKIKTELDPNFRFKNVLWNQYYLKEDLKMDIKEPSEFRAIMNTIKGHDDMYLFLQNVFHLYPEDKFLTLIKEACEKYDNDEQIYRYVQNNLKNIKTLLSDFTYTIPSLKTQKKELCDQTLKILSQRRTFNGYVEIGSKGRYYSSLKNELNIDGSVYMIEEKEPGFGPADILERSSIAKVGEYLDLDNYTPIKDTKIPDDSVDLVICYIGLHHIDPKNLVAFINSIKRVLRKGGCFVLRDHDASTPYMVKFASLIHTVFNLGLNETVETNTNEPRHFNSLVHWENHLSSIGLTHDGIKIYQQNDPSKNALMLFIKE